MKRLYYFIKKDGPVSINVIKMYEKVHPECEGKLELLIKAGRVVEKEGLYSVR